MWTWPVTTITHPSITVQLLLLFTDSDIRPEGDYDLPFLELNFAELNFAELNFAELNFAELNFAELNFAELAFIEHMLRTNLSFADFNSIFAQLNVEPMPQYNILSINNHASELGFVNNMPATTTTLTIYIDNLPIDQLLILGQTLAKVKFPQNLQQLNFIFRIKSLGHGYYDNIGNQFHIECLHQAASHLTAEIVRLLPQQESKINVNQAVLSDCGIKRIRTILQHEGLSERIFLRNHGIKFLSNSDLLELIDLIEKNHVESNLWDKVAEILPSKSAEEIVDIINKLPPQSGPLSNQPGLDIDLQVQIIKEQKFLGVMELLQNNPAMQRMLDSSFYIGNTRIFCESAFLKFVEALHDVHKIKINFNDHWTDSLTDADDSLLQQIMHIFKNKELPTNLWQKISDELLFGKKLERITATQLINMLQMFPKSQITMINERFFRKFLTASIRIQDIMKLTEVIGDNHPGFYKIFFDKISSGNYDNIPVCNAMELIDKLPPHLTKGFVEAFLGSSKIISTHLRNNNIPYSKKEEEIYALFSSIIEYISNNKKITTLDVNIDNGYLQVLFRAVSDKITLVLNQRIIQRYVDGRRYASKDDIRENLSAIHKDANLVIESPQFVDPDYSFKAESLIDDLIEFTNIKYLKIDNSQYMPLFKFKTAGELLEKFARFEEVEFGTVKLSRLRQLASSNPYFLNKTFVTSPRQTKEIYVDLFPGDISNSEQASQLLNSAAISFETINIYDSEYFKQKFNVEELRKDKIRDFRNRPHLTLYPSFVRFCRRNDLGLSLFGSQNKGLYQLPIEVKTNILSFMPMSEISRLKELCKIENEQEVQAGPQVNPRNHN
jgi:hypothetical protein